MAKPTRPILVPLTRPMPPAAAAPGKPVRLETNGFLLRSLVPDDVNPQMLGWLANREMMQGLNLPGLDFDLNGLRRFVAGFGMLGKLQRSAGKAVGQGHRIHRASAGAAEAGKFDAPIFQQCIKHAPGKRAVRAPALQGEVEVANLRGAWVCGHSRIVIP